MGKANGQRIAFGLSRLTIIFLRVSGTLEARRPSQAGCPNSGYRVKSGTESFVSGGVSNRLEQWPDAWNAALVDC
jgi:hypothetical protein